MAALSNNFFVSNLVPLKTVQQQSDNNYVTWSDHVIKLNKMATTTLALGLLFSCVFAHFEPKWDSLDTRPLPQWFEDAKFGIFIHWGVFSVPSFGSEWFWWYWKATKSQAFVDFMAQNYPPHFQYGDFAAKFRAEFYDPNAWADIFASSGAKLEVSAIINNNKQLFTGRTVLLGL
jgi:hypothetical protein